MEEENKLGWVFYIGVSMFVLDAFLAIANLIIGIVHHNTWGFIAASCWTMAALALLWSVVGQYKSYKERKIDE